MGPVVVTWGTLLEEDQMLEYASPLSLEALGYTNYGREAYESYCKSSGGKSLISGADLPEWDKLGWQIQLAWHDAARGVITKLRGYPGLPDCPNRMRQPGEARYGATIPEESLGEILGLPFNHRIAHVEHDHATGAIRVFYELVTPLITGFAGMDTSKDTQH